MEYKISNDQFIIEYEGFRIIMELKDKIFTEHLNSLAPEQWVDLLGADHSFWECGSLSPGETFRRQTNRTGRRFFSATAGG